MDPKVVWERLYECGVLGVSWKLAPPDILDRFTNVLRHMSFGDLPNDTAVRLAAIEARLLRATPGPIDVHRIDQGDGTIAYQLQQSPNAPWPGNDRERISRRVLTQYDDLDNPDARHDAEFHAKAHDDVPWLLDVVRKLVVRHERVVSAMQAALDIAKGQLNDLIVERDTVSLRESALHVMLRAFALPIEPKALAREIKARTTELEALRASITLPDDSEAFVAMVEGELQRPTRGDGQFVKHAEQLIALVRGLTARISDLEGTNKAAVSEMMTIVANVAKELPSDLCDPQGNEPVWLPVQRMRERIAALEPEANAWRDGHEVIRELRERVIPCGHKVEDLIGGAGSVTKCGACLAARQKVT